MIVIENGTVSKTPEYPILTLAAAPAPMKQGDEFAAEKELLVPEKETVPLSTLTQPRLPATGAV